MIDLPDARDHALPCRPTVSRTADIAALGMTPRPWLAFDFGGDVGFFPETRSYSVFVGMTIIPVVWWRS